MLFAKFFIFAAIGACNSVIAELLKSNEDDVCYIAEFSDDVKPCDGFDNEFMEAIDLTVGAVSGEEGSNLLGLNGKIILEGEGITEGLKVCLKAYKLLDIGKEFLYEINGDVCSNLKNEDAPWYPILNALNVTQCPIPARTYNIEDLTISLEYAKDVMRHEFCGEYEVHMSICNENLEEKSCHVILVTITEVVC